VGSDEEHLHDHPIDPDTGAHRFIRDWHYEDHIAQMLGMPYAFSAGAHNEMIPGPYHNRLDGDDGFVKSIDSKDVRIHILGDMTWVKGKIVRKYVEGQGASGGRGCLGRRIRMESSTPPPISRLKLVSREE